MQDKYFENNDSLLECIRINHRQSLQALILTRILVVAEVIEKLLLKFNTANKLKKNLDILVH